MLKIGIDHFTVYMLKRDDQELLRVCCVVLCGVLCVIIIKAHLTVVKLKQNVKDIVDTMLGIEAEYNPHCLPQITKI